MEPSLTFLFFYYGNSDVEMIFEIFVITIGWSNFARKELTPINRVGSDFLNTLTNNKKDL